jgi:CopG antitoxin of type II toxin-antitoxin system
VSTTVTISLPDDLYEQIENLAQHTHRNVAELLTDTIAASLHGRGQSSAPLAVADLSDEELLALVELQLPPDQDRRFSELLDRQQAGRLTPPERAELLACM